MATSEEVGAEHARANILEDSLRYQWVGHAGPWGKDFAEILLSRYGLKVLGLGRCAVSDSQSEYARGYNRVIREELIRRHGIDVIAAVQDEAKATAQERYDRWAQSKECGDS